MEGLTSKKTNEPPKKVNHKGNIKFLNPLQSGEAYQIRKIKGRTSWKDALPRQTLTDWTKAYLNCDFWWV